MEQRPLLLFLRGAQLVLWSSVLTVLDLDEVDVTLENAAIFGSVLSGEGGSADGWQCCRGAPSPPQLPPATSKNPPSFIASLLLLSFRGDGSNQYSIQTAGGKPKSGVERTTWYNPSFSCVGNLKILHSQPFAAIYIYADIAGF